MRTRKSTKEKSLNEAKRYHGHQDFVKNLLCADESLESRNLCGMRACIMSVSMTERALKVNFSFVHCLHLGKFNMDKLCSAALPPDI